jgi:hypothetical protein
MVAWLRHTARQLGHQSPLEPPLLATMENHTYQEVHLRLHVTSPCTLRLQQCCQR